MITTSSTHRPKVTQDWSNIGYFVEAGSRRPVSDLFGASLTDGVRVDRSEQLDPLVYEARELAEGEGVRVAGNVEGRKRNGRGYVHAQAGDILLTNVDDPKDVVFVKAQELGPDSRWAEVERGGDAPFPPGRFYAIKRGAAR